MEVPYIKSGAMSRNHYALVRKVESANSVQLADQYLLAEVDTIRQNLASPGLSLVGDILLVGLLKKANYVAQKRCKEYLIVLMYCSMAISTGVLAHRQVSFAFRHAINLAEASETLKDKRIGANNSTYPHSIY
jgi:AP-4 complex subunit epsilon-1